MGRFRFGEILATVQRVGPVADRPGHEWYTVRLDHPDGYPWLESKLLVKSGPRTAGSDFDLAARSVVEMTEAVRDPELWRTHMSRIGQISQEEISSTLEFAQSLSPYLQDAVEGILRRMSFYLEHWEGKKQGGELGIGRALDLPEHIRTKEDLANFFAYLYIVEKLSFHPDEDFNTYVDRDGSPSFETEKAHNLNRLMAEAFQVATANDLDIYEVAMWVQGVIFQDEQLIEDVPEWLVALSDKWL